MGQASDNVINMNKAINANSDPDAKPLGFQLFWDATIGIEGGSVTELAKQFNLHGIDKELVPSMGPERRLKWAFRLVARSYDKGTLTFKRAGRTGGNVTYRPIFIEKAEDSASDTHKPTLETRTGNGIAVDRDGNVTLQEPASEIGKAVLEAYEKLEGRFNSKDLTNILKNAVARYYGLPLRDRGGVYFVPYSMESELKLKALAMVLEDISDSKVYICTLPNTEQWRKAATGGIEKTLDGQYKGLLADLEGFVEKVEAGDLLQPRTLKSKIKQAKDLREKAELFKDILSLRNEDLSNASECVLSAMREMLEKASDIRELNKAKGNSKVAEIASDMTRELKENARKFLDEAKDVHKPVEATDDDDDEDEEETPKPAKKRRGRPAKRKGSKK